jgi:large subunit ribosomal protein L10
MALTRDKKKEIVDEVSALLNGSKMTVIAAYPGTDVKAMQALRHLARENGTIVRVVKNRLVVKALEADDKFENINKAHLVGQLLYAFNSDDEVAPAQNLASFAKTNPTLEFIGAITADGTFIEAADVKALASLPGKEQLKAQLVGAIAAPLSGFASVLSGNLRSVLNALGARSEAIG